MPSTVVPIRVSISPRTCRSPAQAVDVGELVRGEDGDRLWARRLTCSRSAALRSAKDSIEAVLGEREHERRDGVAHLLSQAFLGERPALDGVVQKPGSDELLVEAGFVQERRDLDDVVEKRSAVGRPMLRGMS